MSAELGLVSQWLALAMVCVAAVAGAGALMARAVFVMFAQLVVCAAAAGAALLLLGSGDGALAIVLFGAGWAPLLLLAAMLLSGRAAKRTRRRPWASLGVVAIAAGAVVWGARDLAAQAAPIAAAAPGSTFWMAPLIVVCAVAVIALLGFGERGALASTEHGA